MRECNDSHVIYIIIIGQFGCLSVSWAHVIGPRAARAWHVIGPHGQHTALAGIQAKNERSKFSACIHNFHLHYTT